MELSLPTFVKPKSPFEDKQRLFVGCELGLKLGEELAGRLEGFNDGLDDCL